MGKNFNLRFAVGTIDGPRSAVWRVATRGDDVYVAHANGGRVAKISFHKSRICRRAFTSEYGAPAGMADRAIHKWTRPITPPAGTDGAIRLLSVGFATDYLSTALKAPTKKVVWIPAASKGTRVIELALTNEDEQTVRNSIGKNGWELISHARLTGGEALCVWTYEAHKEEKDFLVPSSHHEKRHLVVSSKDPKNTGRPVRITINDQPKDGDVQNEWEFGGYWEIGPTPADIGGTLTRTTVLAKEQGDVKE